VCFFINRRNEYLATVQDFCRLISIASEQAATSQVHLDRIQRFFIANSASEHLKEESKDSTRVALIKKLNDV
jgi:hypothetical protein